MEFISKNVKQTGKIAKKFSKELNPLDVITMRGDLGAGKTTFTKALGKALKIKEPITSPTFTIMNEYMSGKMPLYHFDMYRIENDDEIYELGLSDYFIYNPESSIKQGVCVIEWAENIENIIPKKHIEISIEKIDDTTRKINIERLG